MSVGSDPGLRAVRVAVDAMGGDYAPEEIVAGAVQARHDATLLLVGDRARIEPLLARYGAAGEIEIIHALEDIAMDAHPAQVLRGCERTSLGGAIELVRNGGADAVVSAGNSGAFLAIALVRLRTIAGIARPAIAAVLPGKHGPFVLLDAGANVDCKPEWIAQFGLMGSAYARAVLGIAEPKVGIVSVGEERAKGNAQVIEAARCLDAAPIRFIGNIEGDEIFANAADVVVADGFVGNVILKLSEGLAQTIVGLMRAEVSSAGPIVKLGACLMLPAMRRMKQKIAYETYGGAQLLGLRGTCIVAHGRANRDAVYSAVRAAVTAHREGVVERIASLLDVGT
jgi:glycerol-3-phosphate acyltransferase PlsX